MADNYKKEDSIFGDKTSHPAFGTASFSRISCGKAIPLFGSSIKHQSIIGLTIKRASNTRGLNEDFITGNQELIQIEMSNSQFAELITGFGSGSGIPCTIVYTEKDGTMPAPEFENKREIARKEFSDEVSEKAQDTKDLINDVRELFDKKSALSKTEKEAIMFKLHKLESLFGPSSEFMVKQFDRQMEKSVTEAKSEIESFYENKMLQIASDAIIERREEFLAEKPMLNI